MVPASLEIGDVLGRYVIEEVLGAGGMGVVYRASDPELGRKVALKVLRPRADQEAASWLSAKARMLREARAAAALSHESIVTIFDIGEADGLPFLAMELIEGHTLRALLSSPEGVSHEQALTWLGSVAEALASAHRAGIVHRDVKPENVMVRVDGRVKVLDLGIARSTSDAEPTGGSTPALPTLTGEGQVVGTVTYMSPEQIRCEPVDGRSDQFAWGVLAYELLGHTIPWTYRGNDPMALVAAIVSSEPTPLSILSPDVPFGVSDVVMRALSKAKESRFATMDELVLAWHAARQGASSRPALPSVAPTWRGEDLGSAHTELSHSAPSIRGKALPPPESVPTARVGAPVGVPRRARRRLPFVALGLMCLAGCLSALLLRHRDPPAVAREPPAPLPAPSGSVAAAAASSPPVALDAGRPSVTRLQDLPRPVSSSKEALDAYDEGIRRTNEGVNDVAHVFERALDKDPELFAADVRIVAYEVQFSSSPEDRDISLRHYRRALAARGKLSPRDRALIDALVPVTVAQPTNWKAGETELRKLLAHLPGDLEIEGVLGHVLFLEGSYDEASAVFDHMLALDPGNVDASQALADRATAAGALGKARELDQACVNTNPGATICLESLVDIGEIEGKCAEVEGLADRIIVTTPDDVWGYIALLEAQLAEGVPATLLDTTMHRLLLHVPEAARPWASVRYPWLLAVWSGDFARASKLLGDELAVAVKGEDIEDQLYVERDRAAIAVETEGAGAVAAAQAYLERKRALPPGAPTSDSLARDSTPTMLKMLERAGVLTSEVADARRAAWVSEWTARAGPSRASSIWVEAYARPAETETEAAAALAVMPADAAKLLSGGLLESEAIGRTYLFAGNAKAALPFLERAAAGCMTRRFPFAIVRARYLLGVAREQLGDQKGACTAFGTVLKVWGRATPRSHTADLARLHEKTLGCAAD